MHLYTLGKIRTECPQCHRRTFKPYVDADGNVLDYTVGRCNRENSCCYHKKPRDYFAETGNIARPPRPSTLDSKLSTLNSQPSSLAPRPSSPSYIPADCMFQYSPADVKHSPVFKLLERNFGEQTALDAASLYFLAYDCRSNNTLFWLIDANLKIRSGKYMRYNMDGRRDRSTPYAFRWAHTQFGSGFNYVGCFFGSHLAAGNHTVILVESEKTALILTAWLYSRNLRDRYVVMATGGSSGISFDPTLLFRPFYKYYPLRRKKLLLIPDADAVEKWRKEAWELGSCFDSVKLWDIRPWAKSPSDDIGDIILRRIAANANQN